MLHLWLILANLFPIQWLTALGPTQGPQHTRTHIHTHKHCQWVLTQSRCWQLCSKWKQGSQPTTWTTLPIKWYVYNNTVLRLWRHTHMCTCAHTHTCNMQAHSQSRGNELMESQRTTLGAKQTNLWWCRKGEKENLVNQKKKRKTERQGVTNRLRKRWASHYHCLVWICISPAMSVRQREAGDEKIIV